MNIKIQATSKALSSNGGTLLAKKILDNLRVTQEISPFLPQQERIRTSSPGEKFEAICLSFLTGAECLDDIEFLKDDPAFSKLTKVNSAQVYGDFLRGFTALDIQNINHKLVDNALKVRNKFFEKEDFILDIDSTIHIQSGKKMEGLGYDYDNNYGLTSLQAYDQYGIQYWLNVREGNTFTSEGSIEAIDTILGKVHGIRKYIRADSGYCNTDFMNACFIKKAYFLIKMRGNMLRKELPKVDNWKRSHEIFLDNDRECDIGSTTYTTCINSNKNLMHKVRLIIIRSEKIIENKEDKNTIFDKKNIKDYEYFAFATNIENIECDSINGMSNDDIVKMYRKRGNAENFIRETKNGFDLKHFPCKKLLANKAYGIIAAFSHNIMRLLSFTDQKLKIKNKEKDKKIHFSKIIRNKAINIAVQVVQKSRNIIFKFADLQFGKSNLY